MPDGNERQSGESPLDYIHRLAAQGASQSNPAPVWQPGRTAPAPVLDMTANLLNATAKQAADYETGLDAKVRAMYPGVSEQAIELYKQPDREAFHKGLIQNINETYDAADRRRAEAAQYDNNTSNFGKVLAGVAADHYVDPVFAREHSDPSYRNHVLNIDRYRDELGHIRKIPESEDAAYSLTYGGKYTDQAKKAIDKRGSKPEDTAPVDMSDAFDNQGNVRTDFLYKLNKQASGSQSKMRDLFDQYMRGKQTEYNTSSQSIEQVDRQVASDRLHGESYPLYYLSQLGQATDKGMAETYALVKGVGSHVSGELGLGGEGFDKAYTDELQRQLRRHPDMPASDESNNWYNLDHVLSSGARMTGEFLPTLFSGGAGEAGMAAKAGYGSRLLMNSLHVAKTASPQIFAGYVEDGLARGFTPDEAIKRALVRTPLNILAMSVPGAAVPNPTAEGVVKGILEGGEQATGAKLLAQKAGQFIAPPVAGATSFATASLADSYLNHIEDVKKFNQAKANGEVPQDADAPAFDYKTALNDAAQQGGLGLIWGTIERLKTAPGTISPPSQAKYIYDAVSAPKEFDGAVQKAVNRKTISPEQGSQLIAFRDRVTPFISDATRDGYKPHAAAQIGVEQARLDEIAKTITGMGEQIKRERHINPDGTEEILTLAPDEQTGVYTPEAGSKAVAKLQDLHDQAQESAKTLAQLKEGSYVRGRTVSGNELLQLTGKFTPEGGITPEQARRIITEGPYSASEQDITRFSSDPEISKMVAMMRNPEDAKAYSEQRAEIESEKAALLDPHTEKKDGTGTIIRKSSEPSEETKAEVAALDSRLKELDSRYPNFAKDDDSGFTPISANAPVLGENGSIIDGRKRIALALAKGQTRMEVISPRAITEVMKEAADEHAHPLAGEPVPPPQGSEELAHKAADAYHETNDPTKGAIAAAEVIHEAEPDPAKAVEVLRSVAPHLNEPQAEAFLNVAGGTREMPAVEEIAPEVKQEPEQVAPATTSPDYKRLYGPELFSHLQESPLFDKESGTLKSDVTEGEVADYLLDAQVPERYNTAGNAPEANFEPEAIAGTVQELQQFTDAPAIAAAERRTADQVEQLEPTIEALQSQAADPGATQEQDDATERDIDKAIASITGDSAGASTNLASNEPSPRPNDSGGTSDEPAGNEASEQTQVVKGRANILVSAERLKAIGWSKKGAQALAVRLRNSFGGDTGVATIDGKEAERLSKRRGDRTPDAWYDNGILYLNIDALGRVENGKRSGLTPSTVLHESGHLWAEWAKEAAPELHGKGMDLARQSEAFKFMTTGERGSLSETEIKRWKSYVDAYKSRDNAHDLYAEEVLAHGIQEAGKAFTGEKDLKSEFGKWLYAFWEKAKQSLGFKNLTARQFSELSFGDFTSRVAHEIGSGKELTRQIKEAVKIVSDPSLRGRLVEQANFNAEAADRLDIVSESAKPKLVLNEDAEASAEGKPNAIATTLASRISPSDILPAIERANPKLVSDLIEAVQKTSLFKGGDAQAAESALLDAIDNPRALTGNDLTTLGGVIRRRGSSHLTGLLGDFFKEVHSIVEKVSPDSGVRAVDIAEAFAHNAQVRINEEKKAAQRSAKAKPNDARFSLPDNIDPSERQALIDSLKDAADRTKEEGGFGGEVYRIIQNANEGGIITRDEMRSMARRLHQAVATPESIKSYIEDMSKMLSVEDAKPDPKTIPLEPKITGTKHATVAAEREARGIPAVEKEGKRTFGEVWEKAKADMSANNGEVDDIIKALTKNPRPVSDLENAKFLIRQIELQNQQDTLFAQMDKAIEGKDDAQIAEIQGKLQRVGDQLGELYLVLDRVGTETGRALNARRMLAANDFSLAKMLQTAKASKGRELTGEETTKVRTQAKEIAEAEKKVTEHVTAAAKKKVVKEVNDAVKEKLERARKSIGGRKADRSLRESAKDRLRELLGKKGPMFALPDMEETPEPRKLPREIRSALDDLARYYITEGRALDEIIPAMHDDVMDIDPSITEEEVRRAYSGYGDRREPSKDEIEKKLRESREHERLVAAINDVERGKAPEKSGYQRDKPSEQIRSDKKKLTELMKEQGIEVTDPAKQLASHLQATENRLRNEIADLNRQILGKSRDVKSTKPQSTSSEIERLKIQRDSLRDELDAVVGKRGMTDEQKAANALKAIERATAEIERRISERNVEPREKSAPIDTPEIKTARGKLEQLRAEYDALKKEINPPKSKEDLALEATIKATEKSIEEYERRLRDNDLNPAKKPAADYKSPELDALRAKRDKLKEEYQQRVDAAKVRKSEAEKATDAAIRAAEKRISDLQDKIANNDFSTARKVSKAVETPELLALRAERDRLTAAYDAMKEAAFPKKSPEERAREQFEKRVKKQITEYQKKLDDGDYAPTPKKEPYQPDKEGQKLAQQLAEKKAQFLREREAERKANRPRWQRALDNVQDIQREMKLSGIVTLGKLSTAAGLRTFIAPVEEVVGAAWSKLFPQIAGKAAREGGLNLSAERKAVVDGLYKAAIDFVPILTGKRRSALDVKNDPKHGYEAPGWLHVFGNSHAALKNFAKASEFERSFKKRIDVAMQGDAELDDATLSAITGAAYKDAKRAVFMQDSRITEAWNHLIRRLEMPDREGNVSVKGKVAATSLKVLLPFVKIPTNIVKETFVHAGGLPVGLIEAGIAYKKGIENLSPEKADAILRHIKKGSLGAAFVLIGMFNPNAVGGYYLKGHKKKEDEAGEGGLRIGDYNVPKWAVHNPLLECLQIGATMRKAFDKSAPKADWDERIVGSAHAALYGMSQEVPFVQTPERLLKAWGTPNATTTYIESTINDMLTPVALKDVAKATDKDAKGETVKRYPKNWMERFMTGLPVLRKKVSDHKH